METAYLCELADLLLYNPPRVWRSTKPSVKNHCTIRAQNWVQKHKI